ncbi:transferase hexapeptide repeat protein [Cystoisospora suis]|uniref:Dynactin subunit 6 n=1 Tax=Cystoisospora suis TaxID=483139 RepID=A0A2C6LAP9_9APIC|nr:transferase hexapeptide repeat protein [Cystoisospora suis]
MAPGLDSTEAETTGGPEATPGDRSRPGAPGTHKKGKNSKEPLVHPQAVLKGKIELAEGCCVGVASLLDGGESGIVLDKNTVVEDRVRIINSGSEPMIIGRYTWIEDRAVIQDVRKIGDFVRIEAGAEVIACEEIGNGCNVAEGAKVKSRGIIPPQTIFYGDAGLVAYDPSSMVRQAASAVAQLPTHRRLLTNHI